MSVKMAILFSAFVPLQYGADRPRGRGGRGRRPPGRKARAQSIYFSNEARIAFGDGGRGGDALVAGDRPTRVELLDDGRGRGGPHFLGTPLLLSGKRLVGIYLQLVVSVLAFLMSSLSASLVYFLKTQRMDGMYLCRDVSHDNLQHALVLLSFRS